MEFEKFDSGPLDDDQMRLENEIMKLRLQAEYGAIFPDAERPASDPQPEYCFLKRVLQLHQRIADTPPRPLREVLDFGQFAPAESFKDNAELNTALWDALDYLEDANVIVDFDYEYPDQVMYDFITKELPELEVIGKPTSDEYICVLYEAFHPNVKGEIEDFATDFLDVFFNGDINRYLSIYFRRHNLPDRLYLRTEPALAAVIERFHGCFESISNWQICFGNIGISPGGDGSEEISAAVCGTVEYTVSLTDGSQETFSGPYRLLLLQEFRFWYVADFELHGFIWPPEGPKAA